MERAALIQQLYTPLYPEVCFRFAFLVVISVQQPKTRQTLVGLF
jgi:hypothetical protein